MKRLSILDLPEDRLEGDQSHRPNEATLDPLVREVANTLAISSQELSNWAKEVVAHKEVLNLILRTALRLKLNPLLGQIDWELNLDGSYEVYIPIDGWITMIHREPSFKGLSFHQSSETEEGIPIWMECSIYRADLIQPIAVREYYAELKTDHPIWNQLPRRMLRHKTLQQCARFAFGINMAELDAKKTQLIKPKFNSSNQKNTIHSRKDQLKEKLRIGKI